MGTGQKQEIISKKIQYFREGHPPKRNRRVLLTGQFQTDWLKVTFLQEVETAVRLGIKVLVW